MKKALVVALVLLVSGCSVPPATPETAAPSPTNTPTPTPSSSPTPTEDPWLTYTSPDGSTSFEHPSDWSVKEHPFPPIDDSSWWNETVAANPLALRGVEILDQAGVSRLTDWMYLEGIGGACQDEFPSNLLDTADTGLTDPSGLPIRFEYQALETSEGVLAAYGLTTRDPVATGCLFYYIASVDGSKGRSSFSVASNLQLSVGSGIPFDSVAAAKAYMDTEDYQSIRRILLSFRIN